MENIRQHLGSVGWVAVALVIALVVVTSGLLNLLTGLSDWLGNLIS